MSRAALTTRSCCWNELYIKIEILVFQHKIYSAGGARLKRANNITSNCVKHSGACLRFQRPGYFITYLWKYSTAHCKAQAISTHSRVRLSIVSACLKAITNLVCQSWQSKMWFVSCKEHNWMLWLNLGTRHTSKRDDASKKSGLPTMIFLTLETICKCLSLRGIWALNYSKSFMSLRKAAVNKTLIYVTLKFCFGVILTNWFM